MNTQAPTLPTVSQDPNDYQPVGDAAWLKPSQITEGLVFFRHEGRFLQVTGVAPVDGRREWDIETPEGQFQFVEGAMTPARLFLTDIPRVGMGATHLCGSDRYPYTVIEVLAPDRVVVQADFSRRIDNNGLSESQVYEYAPNEQGRTYTVQRSGQVWRSVPAHKGDDRLPFSVGSRRAYQ